MTNEEAKDLLMNASGSVETITALSLAVRALEKQIPKKPSKKTCDFVGDDYRERKVTHDICPSCGAVLSFGCAMEWCMYCGQKISWEENE